MIILLTIFMHLFHQILHQFQIILTLHLFLTMLILINYQILDQNNR